MLDLTEIEALEAAVKSNASLSQRISAGRQFSSAAEKISRIFAELDRDQRLLFISLVERYEIHSDISDYAFEITMSLVPLMKFGVNISIITPYINNPKNPKSGIGFAYEVRAALNAEGFRDASFKTLSTVPAHIEQDSQYIMIDDFSGSGRTVLLAIMNMIQKGARTDQINVNVFYIMRSALLKIQAIGVKVSAKIIADRSISDFDYEAFGFVGDHLAVYDAIEANLNLSNDYKRGYEATESLVTFKKTPNNTLPIFWSSSRNGGGEWPAPFPR